MAVTAACGALELMEDLVLMGCDTAMPVAAESTLGADMSVSA